MIPTTMMQTTISPKWLPRLPPLEAVVEWIRSGLATLCWVLVNLSLMGTAYQILSIENSEYAEGRNFDLSLTSSILSFHPEVRLTSTSQQKKRKIEEQKYKYEYEYPYIELHIRQAMRDV